MKIGAGNVTMESTHRQYSYAHTQRLTVGRLPDEQNVANSQKITKQASDDSQKWNRINNSLSQMKSFKQTVDDIRTQSEADISSLTDLDTFKKLKENMLMWLLDILCGRKIDSPKNSTQDSSSQNTQELYSIAFGSNEQTSDSNGTFWNKLDTESFVNEEHESTTFAATGTVQTTDGREISFNVELGMSRTFMEQTDLAWVSQQRAVMTDPLVINFDTPATSLSDQKFYFDIDSDGKSEQISKTGYGSGFLALDKNGDGSINDGSELFGTKSGDGFKDLSAYDSDKNGWIDENDDIYSKLRIWTNDENGHEELIDLKSADVGAIYLGSADTQYTLKNELNNTNGAIRRTGIFLRDSDGTAGTVNHVDLVRS